MIQGHPTRSASSAVTATAAAVAAAATTGLDVELPLELAAAVDSYLQARPGLDANRLLQSALAQFLVQQGGARPEVRELYLDGLFGPTR